MDRRSVLLDVGTRIVFKTILLFALFLLFAGHNAPGGGFVGGLVAGAAFVLRFVADPDGEDGPPVPFHPTTLLGGGIALSVLTAAAAWLGGGQLLQSSKLEVDAPLLGLVKLTTALPFDIGVFLVVLGLVGNVLTTLGTERDQPEHDDEAARQAVAP